MDNRKLDVEEPASEDAVVTSYYMPFRAKSGEQILRLTKSILRNPSGSSVILPTRTCAENEKGEDNLPVKASVLYDVFRPKVHAQGGKKGVTFSAFRAWELPNIDLRFFSFRDESFPVVISGYSYSPDWSPNRKSIDLPFDQDNCDDDAVTSANEDKDVKVTSRSKDPPKKKAKITAENEGTSFPAVCLALLRGILQDRSRASDKSSIHVVNSRASGKCVSVITLPANRKTAQNSVGVLVELCKRQVYGRGRAAVASYSLPIESTGSSELTVKTLCSCWEYSNCTSCPHVETISNHPILGEMINRILLEGFSSYLDANSLSISNVGPGVISALPASIEFDQKPSYWITFNPAFFNKRRGPFVPVLVRAQSQKKSLALEQRVQCQQCRRAQQKRGLCEHESAVIHTARRANDDRNGIANGEADEPAEIFTDTTEDEVLDLGEKGCTDNKYVSTTRRSLLPCPSDAKDAVDLSHTFYASRKSGQDVVLRDVSPVCKKCKTTLSNRVHSANEAHLHAPYAESRRKVQLHSFTHGTLQAYVVDMSCLQCSTINYYDGTDSGLFSATERSVYSRELLDFWLYHVACLDSTFRDSYNLSLFTSRLPSMTNVRLGFPLQMNRRAASTCFSSFVKTISSPSGTDLTSLFRCDTCEDKNGRMSGVALDGTATGILGELPRFLRPSIGIPLTKNCSLKQYILRNSKVRNFINSFCYCAQSGIKTGKFTVGIPKRGKNSDLNPAELLFYASENEHASRLIRQFIVTAFRTFPIKERHSMQQSGRQGLKSSDKYSDGKKATVIDHLNSSSETESGDSSEEINITFVDLTEPRIGVELYEHKLPTTSLRICAVDFLRCFGTSSIPGGLLCTSESINSSRGLIANLVSFSECAHRAEYGRLENVLRPCEDCARNLETFATRMLSHSPAAGRLAHGIATHAHDAPESLCPYGILRDLAMCVALVVDQAVDTYKEFGEVFSRWESDTCKEFNVRFGESLRDGPLTGISDGFEDTGDFFPGRPIQRLRVHFLNANAHPEVARDECAKSYRNSMSHSPGLFTVQCVCDNPKILGISVMDACESLSTATNVLLTRFHPLPQNVYYDNACNLTRSITLRFPWVLRHVRLCCDRFHYRSHKCGSHFDPDSYPTLDHHRTSGAEAINARWASSRGHIRFLKGSNLMPFILAKSVYINLRALYRTRTRCTDVDDADIIAFGNEALPCKCRRCLASSSSLNQD